MEYENWRNDIFGHPDNSDPVMVDLMEETYTLSEEESLDFIDQALKDADIHTLYSRDQIGIGFNIIFNNSCSDIPFCYITDRRQPKNEQRKAEAIRNLGLLYSSYFARYCKAPVSRIGCFSDLSPMNYICYMFWDIFVLRPGSATDTMIETSIEMFKESLKIKNDNCLVSLIHGLGHWAPDTDLAAPVLDEWLQSPTTINQVVLEYAREARTGCIQ